MKEKSNFESDAFEAIHQSASALHKVGAIDKTIMCNFDKSCFTATPEMVPEQIKETREKNCEW
jgi:putative transcriptional regulator